jgi:hypothetical protein
MTDHSSLSHWFPLIEGAGLPVPKTIILEMPEAARKDVWEAFDGKNGTGALKVFADNVAAKAAPLGYPFFLRTDETSGKHNWERTCFVKRPEDIPAHLYAIAEFSECADFLGLPWHTWAIRELLPTIPFGVCPRYGNMPICREFRFFVEDGSVKCWHPYWPLDSLQDGGAENIDYETLCKLPDDVRLHDLVARAGTAAPGSWSIDVLETKHGWFVTDMAEAHRSYHWPSCERLKIAA